MEIMRYTGCAQELYSFLSDSELEELYTWAGLEPSPETLMNFCVVLMMRYRNNKVED